MTSLTLSTIIPTIEGLSEEWLDIWLGSTTGNTFGKKLSLKIRSLMP
jgi:hypothetical protein